MCNVVPPSINNKKHAYFIFSFNFIGNKERGHIDFENIVHILSTTTSMNSLREFTAFGTDEIIIILRPFDRIFSF